VPDPLHRKARGKAVLTFWLFPQVPFLSLSAPWLRRKRLGLPRYPENRMLPITGLSYGWDRQLAAGAAGDVSSAGH